MYVLYGRIRVLLLSKLFLLLSTLFISHVFGQSDVFSTIEDVEGEIKSTETVVVLIASLQCGYCIKDIPYNNGLAEKYKTTNRKFILLLEEKADAIVSNPFYKNISNVWMVVPDASMFYSMFWKKKIFPEVHIFYHGKLKKSFVSASSKTKERLENYLSSFNQ